MINKSIILNSIIAYSLATVVFIFNQYNSQLNTNILSNIENTNPIIKKIDPLNVIPSETKDKTIKDEKTINVLNYSQPNLNWAKSNGKVLIYFTSTTCSRCSDFIKALQSSQLPKDVIILYADFNIEKSLVKKYNIQSADTIIQINENQLEIAKWKSPEAASITDYIR